MAIFGHTDVGLGILLRSGNIRENLIFANIRELVALQIKSSR